MKAYVITEGRFDADLLTRILGPAVLQSVAVGESKGVSSAISLARSVIAVRQKPIAFFADSDALADHAIERRRQEIGELIGLAAGSTPFKIILAVPEIEVLFFQSTEMAERIFGRTFSGTELEFAQLQPAKKFKELTSQRSREEILALLNEEDVEAMRNAPPIQELLSFLAQLPDEVEAESFARAS